YCGWPVTRERRTVDGHVQRAEQEAEGDPLQHQRGREPHSPPTHEDPRGGRAEEREVHGELQEAGSVRPLRELPHGLAIEAAYLDGADIHDCRAISLDCRLSLATPAQRAKPAPLTGSAWTQGGELVKYFRASSRLRGAARPPKRASSWCSS